MCVLCETKYASQKVVDDYQSLITIKITEVDRTKKLIKVRPVISRADGFQSFSKMIY